MNPLRFLRDWLGWETLSETQARHNAIINHQQLIMNAIQTYAANVNAKFDLITEAVTALTTAIAGVADDVAYLKEKIEELQNSPGEISPADQQTLNDLEARTNNTAANLTALKNALQALDAATTRPMPPPAEEPPPA